MSVAKEERAAFEAWASEQGFNITRDDTEKYRDYHRSTTRWAWQARATHGVVIPSEDKTK